MKLFSSQVFVTGTSFFKMLLITRALGPAQFGTLGVLEAYALVIQSFFSIRFNDIVLVYFGRFHARGERENLAVLFGGGLKGGLWFGIFILTVTFVFAPWLLEIPELGSSSWFLLFMVSCSFFFQLFDAFWAGVLKDERKFGLVAAVQSVFATMLLVAIGLLYLFGRLNLFNVVLVEFLLTTVLSVYKVLRLRRWLAERLGMDLYVEMRKSRVIDVFRLEGFWHFAKMDFLTSCLSALTKHLDTLLIGKAVSVESAGHYRLAKGLGSLIQNTAISLETVLFPEINKLVSQERTGVRDLLVKVSLYWLPCVVLIAAGTYFLGPTLIAWVYGKEFAIAARYLNWLMIGLSIAMFLFWVRPLVLISGRMDIVLKANVVASTSFLLIAGLTVENYGADGVAWGLSAAWGLGYICSLWLIYRFRRRPSA